MNPVEVDSDEDDNSVSEQGETNKKKKKSSDSGDHMETSYRYHRSNKNFVSNTFFDDNT